MADMYSLTTHLEQLFHDLIERSFAIIDNKEIIEENYSSLHNIINSPSDQKKKIDEIFSLNEEHMRTILKLRKELASSKATPHVPQLELDKIVNENHRPRSVANQLPLNEQVRAGSSASLKRSMKSEIVGNSDNEAFNDRDYEKLRELLRDKSAINDALEKEILRKNKVIANLHETIEATQDKEYAKTFSNNEL